MMEVLITLHFYLLYKKEDLKTCFVFLVKIMLFFLNPTFFLVESVFSFFFFFLKSFFYKFPPQVPLRGGHDCTPARGQDSHPGTNIPCDTQGLIKGNTRHGDLFLRQLNPVIQVGSLFGLHLSSIAFQLSYSVI